MKHERGFASDNNAGVHPEILKAVTAANSGHAVAYGDDPYTAGAKRKFQEHFGDDIEIFFIFGGTAANVLSLRAMTNSFNGIICSAVSHINVDECGAPENSLGCKLLPIVTFDGRYLLNKSKTICMGLGMNITFNQK